MPDMTYMSYTGRHSRDAERSEMQIGRDAYRQGCREAEMQRGRDAERQRCREAGMQRCRDAERQICRWGRDADGVEMQRAEMHIGAERQICRYTERYIGRKRQRDMGREREGDRETIPAICTDRHTGNYTIIDTDQRQSH